MKRVYIIIALIFILLFAGCQPTGREEVAIDPWADFENHVTVAIYCNTVLDNLDLLDQAIKDGEYIPEDGVMLAEMEVGWEEGDTVFSILQRLDEADFITMDYKTDTFGPFVSGINYLYNGSCGEVSGWMVSVNDTFNDTGCDQTFLEPGDNVKWLYSCDMGPDIGYIWMEDN